MSAAEPDAHFWIIKVPRTFRRASVRTFRFSQGVYDEGEPMDSANCRYSMPRYMVMPPPIHYDSAKYDDHRVPPEWRTIDRFYEDVFRQKIDISLPRLASSSRDWSVGRIFWPFAPAYGRVRYDKRLNFSRVTRVFDTFDIGAADASHIHPKATEAGARIFSCGFAGAVARSSKVDASDELYARVTAEGIFRANLLRPSVTDAMPARIRAVRAGWGGPWGGRWNPDERRVGAIAIAIASEEE
jgi:hypothetical protein